MPGFTTHYLFGVNTYQSLENSGLKKLISEHHGAFSLGLQGPDLFFYYLPSYAIHENNIGSVAHIQKTGDFLSHLMESPELFPAEPEAGIAQAYVMGFLGHYLLDCRCHPYVYWRTHFHGKSPDYFGRHVYLETDIDTTLLKLYKNKLPSSFRQHSTIALTRLEVRTIATVLYYVYSMAYPDLKISYTGMRTAIRSMQTGMRLLYDPCGKKKVMVRKLERLTLGYPLLSPMIASDTLRFYKDPLNMLHTKWRNPWDNNLVFRDSFLDLLETAQADYRKILPDLYRFFQTSPKLDAAKDQLKSLSDSLGNLSYHSGLDWQEFES